VRNVGECRWVCAAARFVGISGRRAVRAVTVVPFASDSLRHGLAVWSVCLVVLVRLSAVAGAAPALNEQVSACASASTWTSRLCEGFVTNINPQVAHRVDNPVVERSSDKGLSKAVALNSVIGVADGDKQAALLNVRERFVPLAETPWEDANLDSIVRQARTCHLWPDGGSLQIAVNVYLCVRLRRGVHSVHHEVTLPSGHTLTGSGDAQDAVLKAGVPWSQRFDALITSNGSGATISNFTIDGSNRAIGGAGAGGLTITNMRIFNARCWGVGIARPGVILTGSVLERNGANCPVAPPGGAIYAQGTGSDSNYGPAIIGNIIQDNAGPGLDVNQVWGGTFTNNIVDSNASWAGVSLYGAGQWVIAFNTIRHPATTTGQPYHSACQGGPAGTHSAAIFLCEDTEGNNAVTIYNFIHDNAVSSWYGILLIGDDEALPYVVPRFNILVANDAHGSNIGCADDFAPGQWSTGDNTWLRNNCGGSPDTGPVYF
jgi:hypothetical protein